MPTKKAQPKQLESTFSKRWTDDRGNRWRVDLALTFDLRGLRCTQIAVYPTGSLPRLSAGHPHVAVTSFPSGTKMPDFPAITTRLLQRLPLKKWLDEFAVSNSAQLLKTGPVGWKGISEDLEQLTRGRRGPRASSVAFYREVAAVYQKNLAGGSPTKAVAENWKVNRSLAGTWVLRARSRGFLEKTERGVARG